MNGDSESILELLEILKHPLGSYPTAGTGAFCNLYTIDIAAVVDPCREPRRIFESEKTRPNAAFVQHHGTSRTFFVRLYKESTRCAVVLNKGGIRAGFLAFEDTSWFPTGVNNCCYVNGVKVAEGPGAGGRITAERMFKDFQEFQD